MTFSLDRKGDLEYYTETKDAFGQNKKSWSKLVSDVWIGIKHTNTSSDEKQMGNQPVSYHRTEITTRYMNGVSPLAKMRFLIEGRYYNVLYVYELPERRAGYKFICELRDNIDGTVV